MRRRPWLLPIAVPLALLWLVLRIVRVPLNAGLWFVSLAMDALMFDGRPEYYWPHWRSVWGGWL